MVNGHSFILIRQVAALVRRALAEVCTVSVLLVNLFVRLVYDIWVAFCTLSLCVSNNNN